MPRQDTRFTLTTFDFDGAILRIQWIVVQIHHAGQRCGETHAISYRSVASQAHQFISLGDIMQEATQAKKCAILIYDSKTMCASANEKTHLFLSLAKNVSGTQIFSAKSPDNVSKSL